MSRPFAYMWEFQVAPAARSEFERHYGADGSWVHLFRRAPGYVGTWLLQDRAKPGRYLTVDRWQSEQAYLEFLEDSADDYRKLDEVCEKLTLAENFLGAFTE